MDKEVTLQEIENQLADLKSRAKRIDYKNVIPRLPKKITHSTLSGFKKRLSNWTKQLEHLERERILEKVIHTENVLESYLKR